MGTVYLAERADGEVEMRVAVKLLSPGIRTEVVRRRFAAERKILGRLGHPGIGRFLDGGVTSAGIPFLVMEYAPGVAIDAYCDDNRLDTDQRLSLFLEVCEAVEYAHGNAVVHRDLKPGNILVSADGQVKLLDFGIAKVLEDGASEESTVTVWGGRPLTLAYASPEQVTGEPVGFASDIYQLGVLLYLLITGRLPTERTEGGSWAELTRAMAGRRVIPPSAAVGMPGHAHGGATPPSAEQRAEKRRTGVAALRSCLAGELDAILLKTLRLEPEHRYTSVAALAREIRRFRDGRPVAARLEVFGRPGGLTRLESTPTPSRPSQGAVAPFPDIQRDRLVVLPFTGPATGRIAHLRHGLVTLLAEALDDSGVVIPVEPAAVLGRFAPASGVTVAPGDERLYAEQFGAGLYVVGEVVEAGPRVRISASLYGIQDDREPQAVASAEGSIDEVFELVDSLAVDLLCTTLPHHTGALARAAASEVDSLLAFKRFMRGEQALFAGDYFAAAESFRRAVEAAPDFALGYYRLAFAAFWAQNLGLTRRFAAEAAARTDRLPLRERRLLEALEHYLSGRATVAEAIYTELLKEAPSDLEAAFLMGTLLFFHNAYRGRSHREARPFFERVLSIQPNHILALLYLSTVVARAGNVPVLDELTDRLLEAYPDGGIPAYPIVARAQRAFASDRPIEQKQVIDQLQRAGSLAAITAGQVVVLPHRDLAGAYSVAQLLISDEEGGAEVRATGHIRRAHLELGRGRAISADRELDRAEALGSREAREFRILFALAPFLSATRQKLDMMRTAVLAWEVADPPDAPSPIPHFAPHHGVHAHLQDFLLGLISARLGAYDQALDRAQRLDAAALFSDDITPRSFANTIRVEVERLRSGPEVALALQETHELGTSVERALSSSFYTHGHARFVRAEMLHAAGRQDEALTWFDTFGDMSAQDVIYMAPARLGRAEILRDRGDAAGSAVNYRRFIELWRDCDPAFAPRVEEATSSLAKLECRQGL